MTFKLVQDVDKAIAVMRGAGKWLQESDKPSEWWKPQILTRKVLLRYARAQEFFVLLADQQPAAAMILTTSQEAQDWSGIDKPHSPKALYIHWLSVERHFAGRGLPRRLVEFAEQTAQIEGIKFLRLDTNANEPKLRNLYEKLGFQLVAIENSTAFYQKVLSD